MKHKLRHLLPLGAVAILTSAGLSSPAEAGWHGGPHYGHHGEGVSFGMSSYTYPEPYYYPEPAYIPATVLPPEPYPYDYDQPVNYPPPNYQKPDTNDRYCREYTTNNYIGGRPARSYGNACMQPDGSWEIQN